MDRWPAVRIGWPDLRRHQRNPAQHHLRAVAGPAPRKVWGEAIVDFALDEQQRDFAASIDAALGAADLPGAVRAWSAGDLAPGRKVWEQLANLGITALAVPEKFDGSEAEP